MGRTVISPSQYRCDHLAVMENAISDEEKAVFLPSPAHSFQQHQQRELEREEAQQSTSSVRRSSLLRNSSRHSHFTLSQPTHSHSPSSSTATTDNRSSHNQYEYKSTSTSIPTNSPTTYDSHKKVRLKIHHHNNNNILDHALYLGK